MPSTAQIRTALDKVLSSPGFAGAERMRRFLRFVIERQLAGRSAELKEYTIGVEVFDRPANYDPRIDPIVRVEARRLRSKLSAYYEGVGKAEGIGIELPKGSYVPRFTSPADGVHSTRSPLAQTCRSIAVLPFDNASRDSDADYLSDGLTQQIIHHLTRVKGLRVVGWNSAARMRQRNDLYEVGRELSSSTVLVGSVRSGGGRLRVTAQLVDVESGAYLWSEQYDTPLHDLLLVEEEIARAIVHALQVQLGIQPAVTGSAQAYELYFKGRYYWNKRSEEGLRRSVSLFREALDLDPSFALAWAGLADSYILLPEYCAVKPVEMMESARRAAEQALALSPSLGEAEASLAMVRCLYDWEWDDGERHFRLAMELNPGYATAFHWYGVDYCVLRGRHSEAATALAVARELEPLSSIIREGQGYIQMLAGQYEMALASFSGLLEFDPSFHKVSTAVGRTYIQMGRYQEAVETLEQCRQVLGSDRPSLIGALGQAYARCGNTQRARELLGQLRELSEQSYAPCSALAAIYIGLREYKDAIACLKSGCDIRDMAVNTIAVHPLYDPLRDDPEFNAVVERVGCLR